MAEWYYIINDEPHKKYYCDDYEDAQSCISLDSMFKFHITDFLDNSIPKDIECPDYSIYKDVELVEVVTGKKLAEIYLKENSEIIADYINKKKEEELRCKKVVDAFNSLSSSIENTNNTMKNLVDSLNKLNDIFNVRR